MSVFRPVLTGEVWRVDKESRSYTSKTTNQKELSEYAILQVLVAPREVVSVRVFAEKGAPLTLPVVEGDKVRVSLNSFAIERGLPILTTDYTLVTVTEKKK